MCNFSLDLISPASRDRCISKLKQSPIIISEDVKFTQTAAVLVPLCIVNNDVCLLYTLRSLNLKTHSGQVSFPGGKSDPGESPSETALRETEEETGLHRDNIDIWSEMSGVQGRNENLLIVPVVGVIKELHEKHLKQNYMEVEEIFTVPLRELCNPENHGHLEFKNNPIPVYIYKQYKIWGITAIITHLFLQSLLPDPFYKIGFLMRKFNTEDLERSRL